MYFFPLPHGHGSFRPTIGCAPAAAARGGRFTTRTSRPETCDIIDANTSSIFAFGFSGGVRTKELIKDPRFAFVKEGINSHWFATGYAEPIVGNLANNSCIRVKRIKG